MIIDWASLSYHQLFALVSKKKTTSYFEIDSTEDELYAWRTNMISKLTKYIRLFNPRDLVVTLEGQNVWRNEFIENYYNNNCDIYWDESGYYIRFDNFLYKLFKDEKGTIELEKLDVIKDIETLPEKHKKLKDLPGHIQAMVWEILPKYKGHRAKQSHWPFFIGKRKWINMIQ